MTQFRTMTGVFASSVLKHLATANLDVDILANGVIKDVVDEWGMELTPVCARKASRISLCTKSFADQFVPTPTNVRVMLQTKQSDLCDKWFLFSKTEGTYTHRASQVNRVKNGVPRSSTPS